MMEGQKRVASLASETDGSGGDHWRRSQTLSFSLINVWTLAFVLCSVLVTVTGTAAPPPLVESPFRDFQNGKLLGCHFGGHFYELEEEWHPNLGNPFGVMACIKCKCLAVHKKRRISGKVACKNFVDQCPKPDCNEPVLMPGECCKLCPGQGRFEPQLFGAKSDSSDYKFDPGYHEFMALMTGRFKQSAVMTTGVGRAYVTLDRRNIHYSLYFDRLEETPTAVHIVERSQGLILYEKSLEGHSVGHKICGVWMNVPRVYFKSLKRGDIQIVLITRKQPEGIIGGTLIKPKLITREVLSSLLFPSALGSVRNQGYGGVAAVDVLGQGDELLVGTWINATIDNTDTAPKYLLISLEKDDGRRKQLQTVRTELITRDGLHSSEVRIRLAGPEQRLLARGKLQLVVTADFLYPSEFLGLLVPKQSCDVYQAVLSEDVENGRTTPKGTAGYALLEVAEDGALKYTIRTEGSRRSPLTSFSISKEARRNRRRIVLQTRERVDFENGRSHGILSDHANIRELELLYKEKLFFEISDADGENALRGPVRRLLHSEAVEMHATPNVLFGQALRPHPSRTISSATAWFSEPSPDNDCTVSFTISISNLPGLTSNDLKLSLCHWQLAVNDGCFAELTDFELVNMDLADSTAFGVVSYLSSRAWRLLSSDGGAYLRIATSQHPDGILAGNVSVIGNMACLGRQLLRDRIISDPPGDNDGQRPTECEYDGMTYKDGDSWHATRTECTMCSCQRREVKCERVVCPQLQCPNSIRVPGECCPSCPITNMASGNSSLKGCYWSGDQKVHSAGSVWHPYLPPFGYSRCALCQCLTNGSVSCSKAPCPRLTCPKELRYRENALDCCQKCRNVSTTTPSTNIDRVGGPLGDESSSGRCSFNSRWYPEGSTFSPKLAYIGAVKCVLCKCQRTRVTCWRPECTSLPCDHEMRKRGCCPAC